MIGATTVGAGRAGASSASPPPVISSHQHGVPGGNSVWCPACDACAAAWCRQAAIARSVTPPGPAASQVPAASTRVGNSDPRRIGPQVYAYTRGWRNPPRAR
ncbi:MAG: hypothetical protein E6H01_14560 [Bacillati bacterium ANGP1]|uniref:Uncharacterized protein n=1 Tax=Candidatus Segetimicrobium genomatis TaxID=2569760 RepID=A0A537KHP1_9BACT|nr:MAG: hypothetical protein E6H01_14560 [Terrabacteria group bacterium ANGP1]